MVDAGMLLLLLLLQFYDPLCYPNRPCIGL